ncbi:hypothetical protein YASMINEVIRUS_1269 [Yasminevirus sp. GU-2018]|uniref:Uncharacterized protein n=1 Tax=Yasminevirus sp. GU-2018 TaxID=2420051 RepID=A0A5K0U9S8_9VIRU|nr:hypothetical protein YASMINEVIRUS_1269 [Yasminevirus sp. GU-2018]
MSYRQDQNRQVSDILVIEQEESPSLYDTSNYYIYIAIAFVYAFFMALLVDRLLNYDRVEKVCDTSSVKGQDYTDRYQACRKAQKEYDTRKFTYMIVLGVFSIFGGAFLARSDKMYETGGWGVSAGGLMLVIYYTVANWGILDKNVQVAVLGLTFFALFYGSTMLYQ